MYVCVVCVLYVCVCVCVCVYIYIRYGFNNYNIYKQETVTDVNMNLVLEWW